MPGPLLLLVSPDGNETSALLRGLGPRLEITHAADLPSSLAEVGVLWLHRGASEELEPLGEEARSLVRGFVTAGGRLLLTGAPAAWLGPLGFEAKPPVLRVRGWQGPLRREDRLGVAPFLDHPLFDRFPGGVYLRRPSAGCHIGGAFYLEGGRPVDGRLLGVEKVFLGLNAEAGILCEHTPGRGRVLSLGAHLVFHDERRDEDPFEEARLRFTADLVDYLMAAEGDDPLAWPTSAGVPVTVVRGQAPAAPAIVPLVRHDDAQAPCLEVREPGGAFFDLTTRHGGLLLGTAEGGVGEIWRLPVRFFRDIAWAQMHGPGDSRPLDDRCDLLRVWPHASERSLRLGDESGEALAETWCADPDGAGFLGEMANRSSRAVDVVLTIAGDQRLMWPYPPGALGDLEIAPGPAGALLRVRDAGAGHCALWAFSTPPLAHEVVTRAAGFLVHLQFRIAAGAALGWRVALAPSEDEAQATLARLATTAWPAPPASDRRLRLSLGNAELDAALAWCRAKGQAFFARTRAHRTARELAGYLAGFDLTRPGWCSGRPGYAWYFGRDGLWCSRAFLAWGDRDEVRANLDLLARYQGPYGEIFHELTPAGVAHYDAADATPMFVDMVARYVDWTGDTAAARELFPHVERALAFVQEHDRDGDGITENTGVGHGWVEGGPLHEGVHAELYLASLQFAALEGGARLARLVGNEAAGTAWAAAADKVRAVVQERFFDAETASYAHALREDGSFDRTETVLGVSPILAGITPPRVAASVVAPYAGEAFTTGWGVRLLSRDDPRYDPSAYEGGSVWPLFTGWVALAEFLAGRPDAGWQHLSTLLRLVERGNPGVLEEVYRGDEGLPMGICRHQAWSHAAVLGPLVEGLLGVRFARESGRFEIAPCLPRGLDRLAFADLELAGVRLAGSVERHAGGSELSLELRVTDAAAGARVEADLGCFFPAPCQVVDVHRDGGTIDFDVDELGEGVRVWLRGEPLTAGRTLRCTFGVRPPTSEDRPAPPAA